MKFKLFYIILLFAASFNQLAAQVNPNILVGYPGIDPTFETGTSIGLWGGSTVVNNNAFEGSYSARLDNSSRWGGGLELEVNNLSPLTSYTFSAYVKVAGAGEVELGVKNFNGSEVLVEAASSLSYEKKSITFTTGLGQSSATIYVYNPPTGSTIGYADNLELLDNGSDNPNSLPPLDLDEYSLVFNDEFNEDGPIDLSKWAPERGFRRNYEEQYYLSDNLSQENGNLVITAVREQFANEDYDSSSSDWRKNRPYADWTSGSINTFNKFSFLYGRVECRAKVSNLLGTWPAIWTVGEADPNGSGCQTTEWPSGGEIDIMENYRNKILGNFAVAGNGQYNASWDDRAIDISDFGNPNFENEFHVWTLIWTEDNMAIYMDDILINESDPNTPNSSRANACPGSAPFKNTPQVLWLNLALGGNPGGSTADLPDETSYLVDYIRVYQKNGVTENIIDDPGFETGGSNYLWGGSSVVSYNVNNGTYAARLNDNNYWGGGYEREIRNLTPNTTYVFSAYAKSTGGEGRIGVKGHGNPEVYNSFTNRQYRLKSITFTTGANATSARVYLFNPPAGSGVLFADDLSLLEVNNASASLAIPSSQVFSKEAEDRVTIFPNPVNNTINFSSHPGNSYDYTLVSLHGQVIKEGRVSNGDKVDVSDILSGFYLLELRLGDFTKTEKIIIGH